MDVAVALFGIEELVDNESIGMAENLLGVTRSALNG
jgi:hypothetical protein